MGEDCSSIVLGMGLGTNTIDGAMKDGRLVGDPGEFRGRIKLNDLLQYLKENPRAVRTVDQVRTEFLRFVDTIGRPVSSIRKADGRAYKDNLLNVRKVALATVIKHLAVLSGLFEPSRGFGALRIQESSSTAKENSSS